MVKPLVYITVDKGVAEYVTVGDVDVILIDWDMLEDSGDYEVEDYEAILDIIATVQPAVAEALGLWAAESKVADLLAEARLQEG